MGFKKPNIRVVLCWCICLSVALGGGREEEGGGVYARVACWCKINPTHPTTSFRHLKLFLCIFVVVADVVTTGQNCKTPFSKRKKQTGGWLCSG